jgi:hypothetical protein
MTIFGEPISTWISIAAIIISLSTLFLSLRKQKHDERRALAEHIAKIKSEYGESIRVIDASIKDLTKVEEILNNVTKFTGEDYDFINSARTSMMELKLKMKTLYDKLGHQKPGTTDPLLLSAVAVEIEIVKKALEQIRSDIQNRAQSIEAKVLGLQEPNKIAKKSAPRKPQKKR